MIGINAIDINIRKDTASGIMMIWFIMVVIINPMAAEISMTLIVLLLNLNLFEQYVHLLDMKSAIGPMKRYHALTA